MRLAGMVWEDGGRWYGALARDEGVVWMAFSDERERIEEKVRPYLSTECGAAARRNLERLRREVHEYNAGTRRRFSVQVAPVGTPFQRRVWDALIKVPYGRATSYGELARQVGKPTAARAVGQAVRRNPVGILIPCHRVLAADGKLGGFGGGFEEGRLEEKRRLLKHEGIDWCE